MKRHPCRECPMLDQDKNNPTCRSCNKRLQYVAELERTLDFSRCSCNQRRALSGLMPASKSFSRVGLTITYCKN